MWLEGSGKTYVSLKRKRILKKEESESMYYKLVGKRVVRTTQDGWLKSMQRKTHVLKMDSFDKTIVSTVFLGIDHRMFENSDPVLFETMIFNHDKFNNYQQRYTNYDDAMRGHQVAVNLVKGD